jgi:hypothetical protein
MGDKSVTEFYQAPVRYLKEVLGRESEFEKPYVDEDYRKMHFDPPTPDWPPFPPFPPWPPLPPIEGPVPGLPSCAIVCYEPLDCDEPIWCHPSIWCGTDLGCTLCSWVVEGATAGYTPHLTGVGGWGIDVWIDTSLVEPGGEALIKICMTDPCGNVCCHDSEITCKVCPPDIVISWDDGISADTIGQGNGGFATAGVAVLDGLGPYSWSVAGTGFSMLHANTEGKTNTLQADDTACGPATITVTDFCGDTTTGYVRCTAGQWTEIGFTSCVITGAITEGDGATRIEGKYKLVENWSNSCSSSGLGCSDPTWGLCYYLYANCHCLTSGCHATMGCTQCLDHGGICTAAGYGVQCFSPSDCLCCNIDGSSCTDLVAALALCSLDTSKLYEWTCVP